MFNILKTDKKYSSYLVKIQTNYILLRTKGDKRLKRKRWHWYTNQKAEGGNISFGKDFTVKRRRKDFVLNVYLYVI